MSAYYNEIDPFAAEWLKNLIQRGLIADGEVDTRSIVDVRPDDLRSFTQCHFFAGIGGWSLAARIAGWGDERPFWTGSCPCQPFSTAGKGLGTDDPRHLWPHFFRLIRSIRPPVVMGEQVAGAAGYGWLDGVRSDLEAEDYACRGVDVPACSVDAPHIRQRIYWVAKSMGDANRSQCERGGVSGRVLAQYADTDSGSINSHMADSDSLRCKNERVVRLRGEDVYDADRCGERGDMADRNSVGCDGRTSTSGQQEGADARVEGSRGSDVGNTTGAGREVEIFLSGSRAEKIAERQTDVARGPIISHWGHSVWLHGTDGKSRRSKPDIQLLAHGVPGRVGRLRAYGNAIVPPLAAEVIAAFMECEP